MRRKVLERRAIALRRNASQRGNHVWVLVRNWTNDIYRNEENARVGCERHVAQRR